MAGGVPTSFLDEHPELCDARRPDGDDRTAALVAAVLMDRAGARRSDRDWGFAPAGWRNLAVQGQRATWRDHDTGELVHIELRPGGPGGEQVLLGDWPGHDEQGALLDDTRAVHTMRHRLQHEQVAVELDGVRRSFRVHCTTSDWSSRVPTARPPGHPSHASSSTTPTGSAPDPPHRCRAPCSLCTSAPVTPYTTAIRSWSSRR